MRNWTETIELSDQREKKLLNATSQRNWTVKIYGRR